LPLGTLLASAVSLIASAEDCEESALSGQQAWTMDELLAELEKYERAMQDANMTPETIQSYIDRAHRFVGWLDGDYKPHLHADRPRYRYPEHRAKS
jgi:hypothetical protein